jgi:hypothetical protein
MSLPLRKNQPLQSPLDYWMSPNEINGFHQHLQGERKGPTPPIGWYWARFGRRTVSNAMSIIEQPQPLPMSQHFNLNGTNIINGTFAVKKDSCCKDCSSLGNSPFSCQPAEPQGAYTKCAPNKFGPRKNYLYNGQYYCCNESPFGAATLEEAKINRNQRTVSQFNYNADPAHDKMKAQTRSIFGKNYEREARFVGARVSTS